MAAPANGPGFAPLPLHRFRTGAYTGNVLQSESDNFYGVRSQITFWNLPGMCPMVRVFLFEQIGRRMEVLNPAVSVHARNQLGLA